MREGIIVQAIGEEHLTILELLGIKSEKFNIGERVYIGKEGRAKILSVLGRIDYNHLTPTAKNELQSVVEKIVSENVKTFFAQIAENPASVNLLLLSIIALQTWIVKKIYALEKTVALLALHVRFPGADRLRND